jgi:hypothetical protein
MSSPHEQEHPHIRFFFMVCPIKAKKGRALQPDLFILLERAMGIEPTTFSLGS